MEPKNRITYDFEKSLERLDDILNSSDNNYEEKSYIPSRNSLSYTNGYYVNVSSIFIDIRDSSSLTENHRRPTVAKIYRSFISEVVAILNGEKNCEEINIVGDCVSGIFKIPSKEDIDRLFAVACKINSIINVLNCKLSKKNIENIKIGIGIDYGRALMIKAGYSGSKINEIVWMGNVVNNASKLGNSANKDNMYTIVVSRIFYRNLNDHNKSLFNQLYMENNFGSNAIIISMDNWYEENCK